MVRTTFATAVLAFCSTAVAKPTRRAEPERPAGLHPGLLWDPSQAWDDSHVPAAQYVELPAKDFKMAPGAILKNEPFVPAGLNSSDFDTHLDKRVIGAENRQLLVSNDYPFTAVGKIWWSNGVMCSGALVGPRHVLTAKHCIPPSGVSARFIPRYDQGNAPYGQGYAQVFLTYNQGDGACGSKQDWAVWVIDTRLGDRVGYFGTKTLSSGEMNRAIMYNHGYPGDRDGGERPYHQNSITVTSANSFGCDSQGPLANDADAAGGSSGSPLWEKDASNNRYIWGPMSSISFVNNVHVFSTIASGLNMVQGVTTGRNNYP